MACCEFAAASTRRYQVQPDPETGGSIFNLLDTYQSGCSMSSDLMHICLLTIRREFRISTATASCTNTTPFSAMSIPFFSCSLIPVASCSGTYPTADRKRTVHKLFYYLSGLISTNLTHRLHSVCFASIRPRSHGENSCLGLIRVFLRSFDAGSSYHCVFHVRFR